MTLNKRLALQTWFHSFFFGKSLIYGRIFRFKIHYLSSFSKFKNLRILPKTGILITLKTKFKPIALSIKCEQFL